MRSRRGCDCPHEIIHCSIRLTQVCEVGKSFCFSTDGWNCEVASLTYLFVTLHIPKPSSQGNSIVECLTYLVVCKPAATILFEKDPCLLLLR